MKSWIEVSGQRLGANYRAAANVVVRESGPEAALLAVIKADGYGHGAALCAQVLAQAGAPWLGVTDAVEGAAVRAALLAAGAPQPRILVMCGHLAEDAPLIAAHRLTPVVWSPEQLAPLSAAAGESPLAIHLEVDTGMCRQGVRPGEELRTLLRQIAAEPRLALEGMMTHLASAEVAHAEQTGQQRSRFEEAVAILRQEGVRPAWVSVGNTSTIDNGADGGTLAWLGCIVSSLGARPLVRSGLGLYGYSLPLEGLAASDGAEATRLHAAVEPVMQWKTRVAALSEVEPGDRIGYCATFRAERPMRLALLPVGYADGLRRELSRSTGGRGGWVMLRGQRAPIVGRISMNLTTVDVSHIADAAVGDEVTLLGENITAEDHAAVAGTIPYEILCGMRAAPRLV